MIEAKSNRLTEEDFNEILRGNEVVKLNQQMYMLPIPREDFKDIEALRTTREIVTARSNLDKYIFNTYFNAPFQKLVLRAIGDDNNKIAGIYKITNVITGEYYIGKSTDIVTRWRWHIRNYISREHKPLYGAMNRHGVDTFTFEVLITVQDPELISDLETIMIDFYQARKFGYNIAKGKELTDDWD